MSLSLPGGRVLSLPLLRVATLVVLRVLSEENDAARFLDDMLLPRRVEYVPCVCVCPTLFVKQHLSSMNRHRSPGNESTDLEDE
jgi:hypothetical protein